MPWRSARRAPEHSEQPLAGYKLAHPMLSADGSRAGFSGVTVGRGHVYLAVDDAICVQGSRHASPSKWCDCGFYCFHDIASARDLACERLFGVLGRAAGGPPGHGSGPYRLDGRLDFDPRLSGGLGDRRCALLGFRVCGVSLGELPAQLHRVPPRDGSRTWGQA